MPRSTRKPTPTQKGDSDALAPFDPLVAEWFRETLGEPSEPQRRGWPAIASGEHTLIFAPTGTGKTLAAFLWALDQLVRDGSERPLGNAVHLLYVSPLKALNNDIERNLTAPLDALRARFAAEGRAFPDIRVAVRTGDTPASARAKMVRKAPHILITTPESLHLLLTSTRARGMFGALRTVVLDEIHALAGTKRGVHLALTLERLEDTRSRMDAAARPAQRIGLSATQRPLEEIARFLGGLENERESEKYRPVTIVDCGAVKKMETLVVSPVEDLAHVGGTVWPAVVERVLEELRGARTTLVFVNNRAQAERVAGKVNALAGEPLAQPYHGSLSRERRLHLEQQLKAGSLRALVTTSALELGIDIGSVDLVIQVQSPKRVAAALQRVGRAGHNLTAVSRGVFIPTHRSDAAEIAALIAAMRAGAIEATRVPQNALDVLAQVVVAAVSVDDWTADELFALVRRAYPYHALTRNAFDEVLAMVSGKYPAELAAELEARVLWDRTNDKLVPMRGARILATISGGTIPDRGLYTVALPDRTRLGELDEEFVHESRVGDVFQLGSSTWRIGAIEHDRVIVTPAPGAPARMPFWHGELASRSSLLASRVGALRRACAALADDQQDAAMQEIAATYGADEQIVRSLVHYARAQRDATGIVPDDTNMVLEEFRDETGAIRLVLHSVYGARVNAPWGMALAQRVREVLRGAEVTVQTNDDGIMLRLPDMGGATPVSAVHDLAPAEAEQRVIDEIGGSSLFGAQFRMNAARALLLPRGTPMRRMPLWLQRLKSADLLQVVRDFPRFPILVETYREVLRDIFDLDTLADVLGRIEQGEITIRHVQTSMASPFAHGLQFGFVMDWMYGDDTPRAEREASALSLDAALLAEVMGERGLPDEMAASLRSIVAERQGVVPERRARTADDLAVLLDRAGDLTREEVAARTATLEDGLRGEPLRELLESRRVVALDFTGRDDWRYTLVEQFGRWAAAYGAEVVSIVRAGGDERPMPAAEVIPETMRSVALTRAAARHEIIARHVALSGPVTVDEIVERYALPAHLVEQKLLDWQRGGKVVRGHFRAEITAAEWCTRRLVDAARRRALSALRKEIEAVELPTYVAFLQRWQHLDPREKLAGDDALLRALTQLSGLARPATSWERDYLPNRMERYDAGALQDALAGGQLVWCAEGSRDEQSGARTLSRLRFVERGAGHVWLGDPGDPVLSDAAQQTRDALAKLGACFLADLQAATGLGTLALKDALRELAAAGLATTDTAAAMREAIRWRGLPPKAGAAPDPTRWLPAGFSPTRPVVQRRPNLRRLPKWRPPDRQVASGWVGRWSLLRTPGTMGPSLTEEEHAELIARQWLARYGIVAREWWRRERPPLSWRSIYIALRRLEMRGEVRRGYFVRGLAGAQFAESAAVEMLRASAREESAPLVVMSATDPANAYAIVDPALLPADAGRARPRGSSAHLVTRAGRVILAAESFGARMWITPGTTNADVALAARAVAEQITRVRPGGKSRDLVVETIDEAPALRSPWEPAFTEAGYRLTNNGLRFFAVT